MECETATSTKYFFYRETLNISSSIEVNGGIHYGQALCLVLAWGITYLLISKGVKSTGKVRQLGFLCVLAHTQTEIGFLFIITHCSSLPIVI